MAQEAEVSGWLHLLFYCGIVATGSYNIAPGSQKPIAFRSDQNKFVHIFCKCILHGKVECLRWFVKLSVIESCGLGFVTLAPSGFCWGGGFCRVFPFGFPGPWGFRYLAIQPFIIT